MRCRHLARRSGVTERELEVGGLVKVETCPDCRAARARVLEAHEQLAASVGQPPTTIVRVLSFLRACDVSR